MENIEEIFYYVDEFCKSFEKWFQKTQLSSRLKRKRKRKKKLNMALSEIATIVLMFHKSGYRCFKDYYLYLLRSHGNDFRNMVCYDRFTALIRRALPALMMMLNALAGEVTEVMFMDSTPYCVCKIRRCARHKVFAGIAAKSKTSTGWFFGLKLHFLFNSNGEIVRLKVTPGNVDDRSGAKDILSDIVGKVFADRGYLGKEFFAEMFRKRVQVITRIKKNMKNILMDMRDKLLLKKRMIVESIFSSIKSCNTFENSRHRNVDNAFCHILSALIMYQLRSDKPTFFAQTSLLQQGF